MSIDFLWPISPCSCIFCTPKLFPELTLSYLVDNYKFWQSCSTETWLILFFKNYIIHIRNMLFRHIITDIIIPYNMLYKFLHIIQQWIVVDLGFYHGGAVFKRIWMQLRDSHGTALTFSFDHYIRWYYWLTPSISHFIWPLNKWLKATVKQKIPYTYSTASDHKLKRTVMMCKEQRMGNNTHTYIFGV